MPPEQRIAAVEEWYRINGSALTHRRIAGDGSASTIDIAVLRASQKQAALATARDEEERELVELQWEVAEAVREMRSRPLAPEQRIRIFDEFLQVNRDVFQEIRTLRETIVARRMEHAPLQAPAPLPPRLEAHAILLDRRGIVSGEIAARLNANRQLPPEERIAAMDRDWTFFQERIKSLREIGRQIQTLPHLETNASNPAQR